MIFNINNAPELKTIRPNKNNVQSVIKIFRQAPAENRTRITRLQIAGFTITTKGAWYPRRDSNPYQASESRLS